MATKIYKNEGKLIFIIISNGNHSMHSRNCFSFKINKQDKQEMACPLEMSAMSETSFSLSPKMLSTPSSPIN